MSGSQITDDLNSPRTTSMLNGLEDEEAKLLIDNKIRFHTQDVSDRETNLLKKFHNLVTTAVVLFRNKTMC